MNKADALRPTDFTRVTCEEVCLICPEVQKEVFEGFFSPRITSEFNFYFDSHLVQFLRQFVWERVDDVVGSSEDDLLLLLR